LDIASRECLEEALLSYRGTVIAVSHDRFFLNRVVTRILELKDGKMCSFPGNYSAYQKALILGSHTAGESASRQANTACQPRSVVVTGKQPTPKGAGFAGAVRAKRHEKQLDRETEIAVVEQRLQELEAGFQDPKFYRSRDSHKYLVEHQQLLSNWPYCGQQGTRKLQPRL
jgi:ATPase subunit of ABC transporter with duplicated ATPase domains